MPIIINLFNCKPLITNTQSTLLIDTTVSLPKHTPKNYSEKQPITNKSPKSSPKMRYKNLNIYWGADNRKAKKNSKIIKDISKPWDVRYDFYDEYTQKYVRIQVTGGVNRYHKLEDRTKHIKALHDALLIELEKGYNPIYNRYDNLENTLENPLQNIQNLTTKDALLWAVDQKTKLEKRTIQTYKSNVKHFSEALDRIGFGGLKITQLKRAHIKLAINNWAIERNINAVTKNSYLENIGTIFKILCEFEIVEANPVQYISKDLELESTTHEPPTDKEMEIISKNLKVYDHGFYLFCQTVYQTGIREKELLSLKIEHIDVVENIIKLYPMDADGSKNTKTTKFRIIPISSKTVKALLKYASGYPSTNYLFTIQNQILLPGPKKSHRNTVSNLWKKVIKLGCNIDKTLYSLKSRGNNDRKQQNKMSDDAIAFLFGHSDKSMSRKHYHRDKLGAYGDEIRNTEPSF